MSERPWVVRLDELPPLAQRSGPLRADHAGRLGRPASAPARSGPLVPQPPDRGPKAARTWAAMAAPVVADGAGSYFTLTFRLAVA